MKGTKVTGIDFNYTEVEAIVVTSYINFRNLNAVAFHPMDFVIGPKIYISTARTIINLYLGTLTYSLLSINRIYWVRMSLIIGQILFRTVFVPLDVVFRLVAAKNLTEWNRA